MTRPRAVVIGASAGAVQALSRLLPILPGDYPLPVLVVVHVQFSRPSIDVLFESAADAYGSGLVGAVLTGANHDGAEGLRALFEAGGTALVEDPAGAAYPAMPRAALSLVPGAESLPLNALAQRLLDLAG